MVLYDKFLFCIGIIAFAIIFIVFPIIDSRYRRQHRPTEGVVWHWYIDCRKGCYLELQCNVNNKQVIAGFRVPEKDFKEQPVGSTVSVKDAWRFEYHHDIPSQASEE